MNVGTIVNQEAAIRLINNFNYTGNVGQSEGNTAVQKAQQSVTEAMKMSGQAIAISEMGRQVNELYNELGTGGSQETIEAAREGLRHTMIAMAQNPDNQQMLNFVNAARRYGKAEGVEALQEAFITSNRAQQAGADIRTWWEAFGNLEEPDMQRRFVEESNAILNAEGTQTERAEVLNRFSNTVIEIYREIPEENREETAKALFTQMNEARTLEQKNETLTNFGQERLSEQKII
ncbi:MAG: hypothetical protein JRI45_00940 [Deltaproteobacteria bacterium]|nr:hypothetical protein [Deltaproteobacteria bacterium]MBW2067470.1 hypothetical protein [Deltaproteobacteria bacterium]